MYTMPALMQFRPDIEQYLISKTFKAVFEYLIQETL